MNRVTARTLWLTAPQTSQWREETLPPPGPGEMLCDTIVSAISPGTELAAWRGAPPLRPGPTYPRVQGYCNVARVIECGPQVTEIAPGDRVLSHASHRSHFLLGAGDVLHRLPEGADADGVAATYLFHLGYNAVLRSGIRAGSRVLVIGLGALGLTSVAMAAHSGAEVVAVSGHEAAAAIARGYGAKAVFGRDRGAELAEALGAGADAAILTTNSWEDFALAQRLAGMCGVIACLGFPGREEAPGRFNPLASEHFYAKQLRIEAVGLSPPANDARKMTRFNQRDNIGFLARAIEDGRIDPAPILSGRYRAADIAQAYRDLDARKDDAVTFLLDWDA